MGLLMLDPIGAAQAWRTEFDLEDAIVGVCDFDFFPEVNGVITATFTNILIDTRTMEIIHWAPGRLADIEAQAEAYVADN